MYPRFIAVIALAIPIVTSASSKCPWLTQGSATALLGGEVAVETEISSDISGSCHFTRRQNATSYELSIYLTPHGLSSCPIGSVKLSGVGTDAVECAASRSAVAIYNQVDGQVRDLHFTVVYETKGMRLSHEHRDAQRDGLRRIAEQVAGNLF